MMNPQEAETLKRRIRDALTDGEPIGREAEFLADAAARLDRFHAATNFSNRQKEWLEKILSRPSRVPRWPRGHGK